MTVEIKPLFDRHGWKYLLPVGKDSKILFLGDTDLETIQTITHLTANATVADEDERSLFEPHQLISSSSSINCPVRFDQVNDPRQLPFELNSFDAIIVQSNFGNVGLDESVVRQHYRLLTKGGALCLGYQATKSLTSGIARRQLNDAGFERVFTFAMLPGVERCKLLLPLGESVAVIRTGLNLHSSTNRVVIIKKFVFALLARAGIVDWLSLPYLVIAYKGNGYSSGLLKTINKSIGGLKSIPVVLLPSAGKGTKALLQLLTPDGKPVAYVKVADLGGRSQEIQNEVAVLNKLSDVKLTTGQVPLVLSSGQENGYYYAIFSALDGSDKRPPLRMTFKVLAFLVELHRKTSTRKTLEQSKYWERMKTGVQVFADDPTCFALVFGALERAATALRGSQFPFVLSHRDFVPWNVRIGRKRVFVVDWEWAQEGHIPFQDLYHYILHGRVNISDGSVLNVAKTIFFQPNRRVAASIKGYSQHMNIPGECSYYFFVLYLVDWVLHQFKIGNRAHLQAQEYVSLLQATHDGETFTSSTWLGGASLQ